LTSLTPVNLLSADPALARPLVAVLSERRTVGPENVAQSVPDGVGVGQLGDTGENLKRVPWRDTPTTAGCGSAALRTPRRIPTSASSCSTPWRSSSRCAAKSAPCCCTTATGNHNLPPRPASLSPPRQHWQRSAMRGRGRPTRHEAPPSPKQLPPAGDAPCCGQTPNRLASSCPPTSRTTAGSPQTTSSSRARDSPT